MAAPALDSFAASLYEQLEPVAYADPDNGYALAEFCATIGSLFQEIDDFARDDAEGRPGWGRLLDIEADPDNAVPYLGQFIGVTVDTALPAGTQRQQIRQPAGFARGTRSALIAAAQEQLAGLKRVVLRERYGSAYHVVVTTYTADTPNPAAVLAALLNQKPAGLTLDHLVHDGQDFAQLRSNNANFAAVRTRYATFNDVRDAL